MNNREFYLVLSFIILFLNSNGQSIQISSGLDWKVGLSQTGPFTIDAKDVSFCVDEAVIDSACGTFYGSPDLLNHFEGCNDNLVAIWGTDPAVNCNFPAITYWFNHTFTLDEFSCLDIDNAVARVQADNSLVFYLNGQQIGSTTPSDWDKVFSYEVSDWLVEGQNDITISVNNLSGGSCFNYAFLAFCLDIFTNPSCEPLANLNLQPIYISSVSGMENCLRDLSTDFLPCADAYEWTLTFLDQPTFPPIMATTDTNVLTIENYLNGNPYQLNVEVKPICPFEETTVLSTDLTITWDDNACTSLSTEDELSESLRLDIFPNPSKDYIFLKTDQEVQIDQIQIFNLNGSLIYQGNRAISANNFKLKVADWPNGLYLFKAQVDSYPIKRRFLID